MRAVYDQIEKVARTPSPVLVLGDTGTGKELVAEAIHRASGRPGQFVAVNCGSLSRELAGSELFGHEKGSFTGAVRRHPGFFKRADGGTLFLDELAEMPIDLQPHFLRVIETGAVLPVGSEREVHVDARIIAATNREPKKAIAEKSLREDFYYRLSVFPITLPPLRARIQDVPLLVDHFLGQADGRRAGRTFSAEDIEAPAVVSLARQRPRAQARRAARVDHVGPERLELRCRSVSRVRSASTNGHRGSRSAGRSATSSAS